MENLTNTDTLFKSYYDQTLERCGWSEEMQKGIIFFLGASIISSNTDHVIARFKEEERINEELHQIIRLYAKPNEAYDPFNAIETTPISSAILTYNDIVLHQFLKNENAIEKYLTVNGHESSIIADANVLEDWKAQFVDAKYTLANCHRLNKLFFRIYWSILKGFKP